MKCKCTEVLINEHRVILRIADVLIAIAEESEQKSQLKREDVLGILEILRLFGDEYHQGKEERALFPVFTAVCDRAEVDAIRHMIHEHDEDRSLLAAMEDAVDQSNPADFAAHARRLDEILRMHIFKEDNILFEIVNSSLSDADDQRILAGFEVFDKAFKSPRHDRLLHRLQMLERRYLPVATQP
jgi:hemerythrin-like domain-containing protein